MDMIYGEIFFINSDGIKIFINQKHQLNKFQIIIFSLLKWLAFYFSDIVFYRRFKIYL